MAKSVKGPSYEAYKAAYKKEAAKLSKKGLSMYMRMYTEGEFKTMYRARRNKFVDLVAKGKRKVVGNVTESLVRSQAYEYSYEQGKSLLKAAKATGQKLNIYQIRSNGKFDWSVIQERRKELISSGLSTNEVQIIIGQEFFGSE